MCTSQLASALTLMVSLHPRTTGPSYSMIVILNEHSAVSELLVAIHVWIVVPIGNASPEVNPELSVCSSTGVPPQIASAVTT